MEQEAENIDIPANREAKTMPLHSPSEWSYDALTRSLNKNNKVENAFYKNPCHGSGNSIISLLNECTFSPMDSLMSDRSQSISLPSDIDISFANIDVDSDTNINKNVDAANSIQMIAGLLLLCISGILDAGAIAYINWLYFVGFTMQEIVMFEGIVELLLCFVFGIITLITNMRRHISFKYKYVNYGAIAIKSIKRVKNESSTQLVMAVSVFGIVSSSSHLTYFIGYLCALGDDHYEIAPLFNSLAIGFAFLWSFMVYNTVLNSEILLYIFLMYIGMVICGYSFIQHSSIKDLSMILNMSNIYLILSAFLDSLGYILIKYASNIATFVFVLSQSVFCGILGLILFVISSDVSMSSLNSRSFSNVIEISSVGLIGFCSIWSFIRGTQLISIGTASFIKMTFFIIFSIVIQVFSIDGKVPHFYCIFGLCLILLSIVLMLIEKFSKFC